MTKRRLNLINLLFVSMLPVGAWSGPVLAIISGQDLPHNENDLTSSIVALQMSELQEDGSTRYYKGTGFLIKDDVVLTAGHNVAYIPDPNNVEVIFSATPCWGTNLCGEMRVIAVKKIVHQLFRQIPGGTEFDLALVKLSSKAPSRYNPISMISEANPIGEVPLRVMGFGVDREGLVVPLSSFRLRGISLSGLDSTYNFGFSQKFWVDQRNGGFCAGDSGAPAIFLDTDSSAAVGIAIHVTYSNGQSHCLTKGAFTDVLFFKKWIQDSLKEI